MSDVREVVARKMIGAATRTRQPLTEVQLVLEVLFGELVSPSTVDRPGKARGH